MTLNCKISAITAIVLAVAVQSCSDGLEIPYQNPRQGSGTTASRTPSEALGRTMILYSAGYNNLSSALKDDIDDICENYLPGDYPYSDRLLVLAHHSVSNLNYTQETSPCLIRIYRDREGATVRDTVYTWPAGTRAVDEDAATLKEVLTYIKDNYPSKEYGLVFSSHSTGWLPPGFSLTTRSSQAKGISALQDTVSRNTISGRSGQERSIGADYGTGAEIDIKDFAAAIPMKLKYLIFDSCLIGGVESVYEFKDICEYVVASQAEILEDGMVYTNLVYRLLGEEPSDITGVAEDFYNHYNSLSGTSRSGVISVVDCAMLGSLADVCRDIFSNHREELSSIDASAVQPANYRSAYFYDFRDIFRQLSLSGTEEAGLDAAIEDCVIYKANTEYFFEGYPGYELKYETFSGLSMYLPSAVSNTSTREYLDSYYTGFKWDQDTGYINF